jgi:serine/threonine protein kinase
MTRLAVPMDFDSAVAALRAARTPQDVFGDDRHDGARVYRALAKLIHPDRVVSAESAAATVAFGRLTALWSMLCGDGDGHTVTIVTRTATYRVGDRIAVDELAEYREARTDNGSALFKVARRPPDNDLFRREATALRHIGRSIPERLRPYVPRIRDAFTHRDQSTGVDRAVNVFDPLSGFVSLASVRSKFPVGIDARDAAWMWRRLLVALGAAHRAGVVHGAVVPDNVLIQPDQHGLVLVNWCYAAVGDADVMPALIGRYRDWYAPEIAARGEPTPGSDIHLATRCLEALLDSRAPAAIGRFVLGCLRPTPAARPHDAWQVLAEFDELLEKLYGPRRFRPFALPAPVPAWPRQTIRREPDNQGR